MVLRPLVVLLTGWLLIACTSDDTLPALQLVGPVSAEGEGEEGEGEGTPSEGEGEDADEDTCDHR